jgi:hypothetical protein
VLNSPTMRRTSGFYCLLLLLLVPFCKAETTEEMLSACRPITESKVADARVYLPHTLEAGICWGAFSVIQDETRWADPQSGERHFGICSSEQSTRTQLIAIFVEYAKRNPSKYAEEFLNVALDALREAFPCRAQSGKKP